MMQRGKLIEEAVRWRIFHQTVREARAAFADVSPEELQKKIEEAVERFAPAETLLWKSRTPSVNYNP